MAAVQPSSNEKKCSRLMTSWLSAMITVDVIRCEHLDGRVNE
ncbi:hypothetical protein O9929_23890 [Vibrio lentus]|nr:hypothetical protein [Vibrio lentus]